MSKIKTTTIAMSIHREEQNPIFGEGAIHVSVDDEAAGPFIVLESFGDQGGKIRIDMEELEAVVVSARELINKFENE